ncbi:MAG: alpha/beta fold hydrolase [bacterium]|nr:alpha/beta fold hydrolase [bacterium]
MTTPQRRWKRWLVITIAVFCVLVLGFASISERGKPDLAPWHTVDLENEFVAEDAEDGFGWSNYLELEDRLYRELHEKIVDQSFEVANPHWNRFALDGVNNPENFPRNWNRSFELTLDKPRGGALLIHGLTDSPYSLRRVGEILREQGFWVVGLRLPGHGTAPSALVDAEVEDWRAAVRIAAEHLQTIVGESGQLVVAGYSNGGALALDLTLDAIELPHLRVPDQVILFSPAIGITRAAALARAHRVLSFMPWFSKLGWGGIEPEYDPYKYSSFPNDAGYQTHVLTRSVRKRLAGLREGTVEFPPVLTFMSLADATVQVEAVVQGLYDRLSSPNSELVIFDINRRAEMLGFFRIDPVGRLQMLVDRPTTPYRLTVIANEGEELPMVNEGSRVAGTTEFVTTELELEWPRGVYSLSHVAVPFEPEDPIYGSNPPEKEEFGIQIGTLEARGERGLLSVSASHLTRLRCNPFFSYVEDRLIELATEAPR